MLIIYIVAITLFIYMVYRGVNGFSAENWNHLAGGLFYMKVGSDVCEKCNAVNSMKYETTELETLGVVGRSKTERVCGMCGNREPYSFNSWTTGFYETTIKDDKEES